MAWHVEDHHQTYIPNITWRGVTWHAEAEVFVCYLNCHTCRVDSRLHGNLHTKVYILTAGTISKV